MTCANKFNCTPVHSARGFAPAGHTLGLWKHKTCDVLFTLVVDGFGARWANRSGVDHLVSTPNKGKWLA
jgi:hypothetical protein